MNHKTEDEFNWENVEWDYDNEDEYWEGDERECDDWKGENMIMYESIDAKPFMKNLINRI